MGFQGANLLLATVNFEPCYLAWKPCLYGILFGHKSDSGGSRAVTWPPIIATWNVGFATT